jgi:HAE1 family hydrophobic/amphiphilic exporter-1
MKSVFDRITRLSIRFRWITLGILVVLMAFGVYAALTLNLELLPSIDIPSMFVLARSNGSTSGDIMLQAYSIPIEDGARTIDGIVNRESSTANGFTFLTIRTEFGTDQTRIREGLQGVLNGLQLPLRTITPSAGQTAGDLIGDLTPDVVLYLYAYSVQNNIGFLSPLSPDVWRHFSPQVLGALPEAAFDEIDPALAAELRARRVGEAQPLPTDVAQEAPPDLPASWQMDRFVTAGDLIELTGIRNLADVFNDFMADGYLRGPLGTTADLTAQDLELVTALEQRCQSRSAVTADPESNTSHCSLFSYLDGDAMAALLTQNGVSGDNVLAGGVTLPANYIAEMKQEDRNTLAAALIAQSLTGQRVNREVPLPDEWRFEEPSLITFSLTDIPLGVISVGSATIPRDELKQLVDNEIVPRLEALDSVANVTVEGGEQIRPDLLNAALTSEGLPAEDSQPSSSAASTPNMGSSPAVQASQQTTASAGSNAAAPNVEEGPALPSTWALFAGQIPGVEELDTADDLLRIPGVTPSQLFNQAVEMAADNPVIAQFVNQALSGITPDVLTYLAAHENGFYAKLSDAAIQSLSPETLRALPAEVQERATAAPAGPSLGEFWQRLASEPELASSPLLTASDLLTFGNGPADTLNRLALKIPAELHFYAVQLIDDLSPDVIRYLTANDSSFIEKLDPQVFCSFAVDILGMPEVKARWSGQNWRCQRADGTEVLVADIASGSAETAAQGLIGAQNGSRVHDSSAPKLPADWPSIAGFVGAQELDTADDLFYTEESGKTRTPSELLNVFTRPDAVRYLQELAPDVLLYVADCQGGKLCEDGFFNHLSDKVLTLFSDQTAAGLPQDVQDRRSAALLGIYVPQDLVTRTNGNNSLVVSIQKKADANTVAAWSQVEQVLDELKGRHPDIEFAVAFEQASYITESIGGVAREGGLGAIMAVVVILIFLNFSVRSTVVTAVSIPTSVALAFVLMKWLPGNVHHLLNPLSENATGVSKGLLTFLLRLFPESITLNIMTLSGLTVAIGRVVDDSIVVLENIYRNVQRGENRLEAVLYGTRDVSLAIFAATVTTVIVFLPIGLFGGIIGAFFLPFGLAVTYALLSSFVVAITVVPLLAYLFIDKEALPEPRESRMERGYRRIITWTLDHRWAVLGIATAAFFAGVFLLTRLPSAFLPSFGEPTITIDVSLPREIDGKPTTIATTDAKVRRMENYLETLSGVKTIRTSVGSGGSVFAASDTITENQATIAVTVNDQGTLDNLTPSVRREAERVFNDLNHDNNPDPGQANVTVSGASLSEQGFGGFAVVVSGDSKNPPTLAELQQYDVLILSTLSSIKGLTNVESSLAQVESSGGDISQTYIRIDGVPAARYTAELETNDTLGLTRQAISAVKALGLPDNLKVGEGYESEQQTQGFQQTFVSLGIAVIIVYFVMVLVFGSLIHPVTILFSLPLAVVGAAVGLAVTGRALDLSSVVGLLMLVGIVVTNAIVLIDRVQTSRKVRRLSTRDALIDGGTTRLRPILMTAIATMVALLPLAIGLSQGAIIAAELGTVVIGGLFSSTVLTLIVVPTVYSLFDGAQSAVGARVSRNGQSQSSR